VNKASLIFSLQLLVIYGAARVLDLYGIFDAYNSALRNLKQTAKQFGPIWSIVGQDICFAMKK